jgi:hypothetical protein
VSNLRSFPPDERLILQARRHPIVLSLPIATGLAAFIVAVGTGDTRASQSVRIIVWLVSAFFILQSAVRIMDWFLSYLVITSRRVMIRFGAYLRGYVSLSVSTIADVQVSRSFGGRVWGYGDILITIHGGGSHVITYVPFPEQIYQYLVNATDGTVNQDFEDAVDGL